MSRLSEVLDQMTAVLGSLKEVMDAEQLQLSAGHVNGSVLQRITEQKSSLLATLDYLPGVAPMTTCQFAGRQ